MIADKEEIKKSLDFINKNWDVQNNSLDNSSRFIYNYNKLDDIIMLCEKNNVDVNYAIHRWYNFQCSKTVENIFCEYGAKHYDDKYDHNIDIIIGNVGYDVKLSVLSKNYTGNADLYSYEGCNEYKEWLFNNQSKENRYHLANKIYVIVDTLEDKCNFDKMRGYIELFIKNNKFENNRNYLVYCK